MLPVRTGATNLDFTSADEEVGILPTTTDGNDITSVWEPDADERFQLERGGRVSLTCEGVQPAVALGVVGPDCGNCGRPMHWEKMLGEWVCSEDEIDADDHPLVN